MDKPSVHTGHPHGVGAGRCALMTKDSNSRLGPRRVSSEAHHKDTKDTERAGAEKMRAGNGSSGDVVMRETDTITFLLGLSASLPLCFFVSFVSLW